MSAAHTIWWAMVLSRGMAVKLMILLSFIHDRTSARAPPKLPLPHTKHVKKKKKEEKNESQRGDCFPPTLTGCERLPPRPLARSLARCSGPPAFVLVSLRRCFTCECCLYPAKTAVAFYSKRNGSVRRWRLCAAR